MFTSGYSNLDYFAMSRYDLLNLFYVPFGIIFIKNNHCPLILSIVLRNVEQCLYLLCLEFLTYSTIFFILQF